MSFEPEAVRAFEHAGWQRAASRYGNSFAHATAPFVTPLLEAAEISHGQHVLDVACGPGHLAAAASARGATSHGLDFSAEMVGIARSNHPEVVVARIGTCTVLACAQTGGARGLHGVGHA